MNTFSEEQIRNYFKALNINLENSKHAEYPFLCPIHGDSNASASLNMQDGLWFCHACQRGGDLYELEMCISDQPFPVAKEVVDRTCAGEPRESIPVKATTTLAAAKVYRPVVYTNIYVYMAKVDGVEKAKYGVVRGVFSGTTEKTFRAYHFKDGKQIWAMPKDSPPILYHLPEVQNAQLVVVVEGEKCADALMQVLPEGFAATCNPFGAGKWQESYSQCLEGKTVLILPDNDEPGKTHAEDVAASVAKYAATVKIGHVPMQAVGSDVADYIESLVGKLDDLNVEEKRKVQSAVIQLMKESVVWQAPAAVPPVRQPVSRAIQVSEPTRAKLQEEMVPEIPEDAMYGWCKQRAIDIETPLGYSYPAMLAVGSTICPSVNGCRSNLYVANLGPSGAGKSEAMSRAVKTIAWNDPNAVIEKIPGSDRGLYKLLEGAQNSPRLLVCDEFIAVMNKLAIDGSTLSSAINTLWNNTKSGGSTKQGIDEVDAKLSILGGLVCNEPADFQSIFGRTTTQGLTRRFIFGATNEKDWCYRPIDILPEPQPSYYTAHIPTWCWDELHIWGKQNISRKNMREIAIRVALVTSYMNQEESVSEEAFHAALRFMEWQEQVRTIYIAGQAENKDAQLQEKIVRVLEKVGYGVRVKRRELHNTCHFSRHGAPMVTRVMSNMLSQGLIGFDKNTKEYWLEIDD